MSDERRCLVMDRHPVVRQGVRRLLADRYEIEEADDGSSAIDLITHVGGFDVAVVELTVRDRADGDRLSGTGVIRALRKVQPGLGIVAHAPRAEPRAAGEAMKAGALGYVAKSSPPDALTRAVDAAADAETFVDPAASRRNSVPAAITRRQREILQLIADGHSTSVVAKRLGLSGETVRTHTKALLARLGARDRAHAVAIALRNSMID